PEKDSEHAAITKQQQALEKRRRVRLGAWRSFGLLFPFAEEPVPGPKPDEGRQADDQEKQFPTVARQEIGAEPTYQCCAHPDAGQINTGDRPALTLRKPTGAGAR